VTPPTTYVVVASHLPAVYALIVGLHCWPPDEMHTLLEHVWPLPHVPHVSDPPHPSTMLPQFLPCAEHVVGVHEPPPPQTLAVPPPPQVCGEVHEPHEETVREVPQLSAAVTLPQFLPRREQNAASVSAVHEPPPQTLAVPPPAQVCGEVQVPHEETVREVPQLSFAVTLSQFLPRREQNAAFVSAVQPQTLAVPPPAQVCGEVQVPHEETVREVPQLSAAVTLPQFLPRREQNAASVSAVQPLSHTP
jgi:hypothetical protein